VVGDERLGGSPTRDGLHHRGLDFEVTPIDEKASHRVDRCRPLDESVTRLLRDDQVDVALAVAQLLIGHTVEFLGQRPKRLGQQPQTLDTDRELALLSDKQAAVSADDIAHIECLEGSIGLLADRFALDEQLNAATGVLHTGKARLAHHPLGHHAPGFRLAVGQSS